MDVFALRDRLIEDYAEYARSFINISDERIADEVDRRIAAGLLWPDPMLQLNPSFLPGRRIDELVAENVLHSECGRIFRRSKTESDMGFRLRLHTHQEDAVRTATTGENYVLTTGTGSGKSLAYIVPIVDFVLRNGSGQGIKAIIVYPMNALANSQLNELDKFLCLGYPSGQPRVTYRRYTGQERDTERQKILANPPDILLTNFVMLELILTRPDEAGLVAAADDLRFLVLDELHTYRGRQGADVGMLVRRVRDACNATRLQCVGTSATLAGGGTFAEQQEEVAQVASRLFGDVVPPANIIGETLRRATAETDFERPETVDRLSARVADLAGGGLMPADFEAFLADPLASWLEGTFGLTTEPGTDRLIRSTPLPVRGTDGGAARLAELTGQPTDKCEAAIREALLAGYGVQDPVTSFPAFAFRLHQFISRGDAVFASLESAAERYVTTSGQQYVPGSDKEKVLLPLAFCRECGQEYYTVRRSTSEGSVLYEPRDLFDRHSDEGAAGFLYANEAAPWPDATDEILARVPEDWLEYDGTKMKRDARRRLPRQVTVGADGRESASGVDAVFVEAPFRFCLHCGVAYSARTRSDLGKLATLGSEGRSTATTLLSMSAILQLRDVMETEAARKLLSFTDNRQDASLQAGHFNDFVQVGLLRTALYRAADRAGPGGLPHDQVAQRAFEALDLPMALYASEPDVKFLAKDQTDKALRQVIGYHLYRDLQRGWRVTSPNLEQCGLLEVQYDSLDELAAHDQVWVKGDQGDLCPAPLAEARPETRAAVMRVLLDFLRRELAIKVDYLDSTQQEQISLQSFQRLRAPWALDPEEKLETARVAFPRARRPKDFRGYVYLSGRGAFAQYLRRPSTFPQHDQKISLKESEEIIGYLMEHALRTAGLVEAVEAPPDGEGPAGFQLNAAGMRWVARDGSQPAHDPLKMPSLPETGGRTNPFFVRFYRDIAAKMSGLEAREHTAQVPYVKRLEREDRFRTASLPVLYCSPTMELGVDIAELNCVNMRNVPPTPANYAQRSGRSGRSGQPALVFTYCTVGSPHDQWYFRRPRQMVAGQVTPPRLDLANEDLVLSHMHSIWLRETRLSLGRSLKEILEVEGEEPSLDLRERVYDAVNDEPASERARTRARRVLDTIEKELAEADWYDDNWLDLRLDGIGNAFDRACARWRNLYRAAQAQRATANETIGDASIPQREKKRAKGVRAQAEAQLELLTGDGESITQSDFYSYRYFASEGFLPGYSFPRLPLSAFVPGFRAGTDEYLQRARFIAISEFGPRSTIYHEGTRFEINKVILPVESADTASGIVTRSAKLCGTCGYLHPMGEIAGPDVCERCDAGLTETLDGLFRMENVAARRRDRISSDEEERLRMGYDLRTVVRFGEGMATGSQQATVTADDAPLATLSYGDTATIWRLNIGWRRRKDKHTYGFVLDVDQGYWAKDKDLGDPDSPKDPDAKRTARVIPFVDDRRNSLLLEPAEPLDENVMASLESALKNAIQVVYQLEDTELDSEALPSPDERNLLLFFESAEGGAGVLRRLARERHALAEVARTALEVAHFDPVTGDDLGGPTGGDPCEAACYECLLSYRNQRDHSLIDRHSVRDVLLSLASSETEASPVAKTRSAHLEELLRQCQSDLERDWLRFLDARTLRLPTHAQTLLDECGTRPDFYYEDLAVAVYVDGPHHKYSDRAARDAEQQSCLADLGVTAIRFADDADWDGIVAQYPSIFGTPGGSS